MTRRDLYLHNKKNTSSSFFPFFWRATEKHKRMATAPYLICASVQTSFRNPATHAPTPCCGSTTRRCGAAQHTETTTGHHMFMRTTRLVAILHFSALQMTYELQRRRKLSCKQGSRAQSPEEKCGRLALYLDRTQYHCTEQSHSRWKLAGQGTVVLDWPSTIPRHTPIRIVRKEQISRPVNTPRNPRTHTSCCVRKTDLSILPP